MTGLRRTVAPTSEPVTLDEVKSFLRVDHDDENALLESIISSARTHCENECRIAFIEQTWVTTTNEIGPLGFPLSRPPFLAVEAVKYRQSSDTEYATLDPAEYEVDAYGFPARVVISGTMPSVHSSRDAWQVTYTAGYGDAASDVPADIKSAVLLVVKALYEREEEAGPLHKAAERLLSMNTLPNPI